MRGLLWKGKIKKKREKGREGENEERESKERERVCVGLRNGKMRERLSGGVKERDRKREREAKEI